MEEHVGSTVSATRPWQLFVFHYLRLLQSSRWQQKTGCRNRFPALTRQAGAVQQEGDSLRPRQLQLLRCRGTRACERGIQGGTW